MRSIGPALALSASLLAASAAYGQGAVQDRAAPSAPADICLTNACSTPGRPLVAPAARGANREVIDNAIRVGSAVDVAEGGGSEADIVAALRQLAATHSGASGYIESIDAGGRVSVQTSPDGQTAVIIRAADGTESAVRRSPH